jgi:ferritin
MDMKAVLPLLSTILQQQQTISDKLLEIILTLRQEQDPVEPTLRFMLQPLKEGMQEMSSMLSPSSNPTPPRSTSKGSYTFRCILPAQLLELGDSRGRNESSGGSKFTC